jgi:hypothetical protein
VQLCGVCKQKREEREENKKSRTYYETEKGKMKGKKGETGNKIRQNKYCQKIARQVCMFISIASMSMPSRGS